MSHDLPKVWQNRPVNIQDPQHPCYPVASVVGDFGNAKEIALHKTHHGAVLTSLGGMLVKEILYQCRIENWQNNEGHLGSQIFCSDPLELLLKYEQYKELGIDVKQILGHLRYADELQQDLDEKESTDELVLQVNTDVVEI